MLKSYLKVAIRNLIKHKGYSFINIAGLAAGMTCCLFIFLYVQNELSYDRFNERADRIYRVALDRRYPTNEVQWASVAPGVKDGLLTSFPEITKATRLSHFAAVVSSGEKKINEEKLFFVDPEFFEIFTFPLREGDPIGALENPNSVVISVAAARKYFGTDDPLGKVLTIGHSGDFIVSGVAADLPVNSHFHFDFLLPTSAIQREDLAVWTTNFFYHTYLLLRPDASPKALEAKLPTVTRRYLSGNFDDENGYDKWLQQGNEYRFFLQALTDIHLHSHLKWEIEPNGDSLYVYLFSIVAVFILLLACINFMNLSTARSVDRAREVGVRRILGSQRTQLIAQFMFESVMLSLMALLLALLSTELLLPVFHGLIGKEIAMNYFSQPLRLAGLLACTILIGMLAGSYPAFFLSSFRPIRVLKGIESRGRVGGGLSKRTGLRNVLVVLQFIISIGMIVGTMVVYNQMQYMLNKKLGFDKEHVLVINKARQLGEKTEVFKQELLKNPTIKLVSCSSQVPGNITGASTYRPEDTDDQVELNMAMMAGDADLITTWGLQLMSGRNFREEDYSDTVRNVLINQTAVTAFGWRGDPIGKRILGLRDETYTVVGVLKDFHFESVRQKIRPLIYLPIKGWVGAVAVRIEPVDMRSTLNFVQKTWQQFVPGAPLQYAFLDEEFDSLYRADRITSRLFLIFSSLAILIACLGLLGLAAFTAERRTKEIGIRKVLGASIAAIVALLSKDFLRLVVVANLVAWPLAWYAMNRWLQDFAYRTQLTWWIFAGAGGLALVIALLTVGAQAIRAALANPVESLRYE